MDYGRNWYDFDFSNGSGACLFGRSPLCGMRGEEEWWRRWLIRPFWTVGNAFYSAKWWAYHRWHPSHRYNVIRTGLSPNYWDIDTLMLHGCFALLTRYVVDEMGGIEEIEQFNAALGDIPQSVHQKEALALYHWWTVDRPADKKRYSELMDLLYGRNGALVLKTESLDNDMGPVSRITFAIGAKSAEMVEPLRLELGVLERKMAEDEQSMLHRLIDIRGTLWT